MTDLDTLLAAATDDPASRPDFYDALLAARLYVIGQVQGQTVEAGELRTRAGDKLELQHWQDANGVDFLPVFTTLDRLLQATAAQTRYIALDSRVLFEAVRHMRCILNPGHEHGREILPDEIDNLLSHGSPNPMTIRTTKAPSPVRLGDPAQYPHDMVQALGTFFARERAVKRAYLALMENEGETSFLVGVETDGDFDRLLSRAGAVVADTAPDTHPVDLAPVSSGRDSVSRYFLDESTPFYERKSRGLFSSLFRMGRA